ncbi:hypothetical protein [Ureibacillus sp. FSL K6-3587]|uniref:hypothetical protein n=1 Tax=Ureibacillus sp. FSL K6-3587 TaxID=2954681 RepID=UPI0031596F44
MSKPFPLSVYKRMVKGGFLEFPEFLKQHDFVFSEESPFGVGVTGESERGKDSEL